MEVLGWTAAGVAAFAAWWYVALRILRGGRRRPPRSLYEVLGEPRDESWKVTRR